MRTGVDLGNRRQSVSLAAMSTSNGRQTIFITGAASGIGRSTARKFVAEGWFVGAFDIDTDGLAALQDELGADNCLTGSLDVVDLDAYKVAIDAFSAATDGQLDLLFNNAGIGKGGLFSDMSYADIMAVVNVNFVGVLNGIHLGMDMLKATDNSLCFTTSSASATFGMPGISVYSATKHAVKGLTEALSVELQLFGSRAADTLPGFIDTNILPPGAAAAADTEGPFRLHQPEAIADAVWAAYHGDKVHWYVPEDLYEFDQLVTAEPTLTREGMKTKGALAAAFAAMED